MARSRVAFVVLQAGSAADPASRSAAAARIAEHCRGSLAKFKQPREIIIKDALPKIGNNKVNRPALRELANHAADVSDGLKRA